MSKDESALTRALGEFEDAEDAHAAALAASEEVAIEGADEDDFEWEGGAQPVPADDIRPSVDIEEEIPQSQEVEEESQVLNAEEAEEMEEDDEEEGGTTVEYMLSFIRSDMDFFSEWRI